MNNALKWINTIAFLAMIAFNAFANIKPLGGNTTGDVSKLYPSLFTPAPITFIIWGVIYAFMGAFIVYQWGITDGNTHSAVIRENIGFWFVISCVLNICWLVTWHTKKIELSTILIVCLLISLIVITRVLVDTPKSPFARLMSNVGFDIYFGWVIAATIANISVMLVKVGWNRFGISAQIWTVIVILIGAFIAGTVVLKDGRWVSGLTVVWAYLGILIKHISSSYYGGKYTLIIVATIISIFIILCSIIANALNLKEEML